MRRLNLLFFLGLFGFNATTQDLKSIFDCVYNAEGIPVIKLETNFNKVINNKLDEEYVPGTIILPCSDHKYTIKLRARGNMRKQVCYFPPVKIDFKNGELEKQKLDTAIDKLKVVFQCREGNNAIELLMKEKLGYEIYKVVSPEFYVLHKQVKFEISQDGKVKYTLDALIIEDESELQDRFKSKVVEAGRISTQSLESDIYNRMVVFQYLIANTDWSLPNRHNVEFLKVPGKNRLVPIAYDFDYAGMVGASYAVPHESLPIKSVEERHFMGHGLKEPDALAVAKYFVEKKPKIIETVTNCQGLEDKAKQRLLKFFEPFWDIVESEKATKNTFVRD